MKTEVQFTDENIRQLFGFEDAEGEPIERLKAFYFKNDTYESVLADLPLRLLVGHKGVGKSALFKIAMAEQSASGLLTILIKPDDIAEIGEKHESLLISINKWKYGLTAIIAEKVLAQFGINDTSVRGKIITYGMKLTSLITDIVKPAFKDYVDVSPARMRLVENYLKTEKIIVYLDDIDRGWQNRAEGITMVSALLNAMRDLAYNNPGLSFKLSLRSDVYAAIRSEDESSDKIAGSVVWHSYTLDEIFVMLTMRVLRFFDKPVNENDLRNISQARLTSLMASIMDPQFYGKGAWENVGVNKVLLSLIRKRPRDMVKLCSLAARSAYRDKSTKIATRHWQSIFSEYSQGVIHDTIVEYKSELLDIERLVLGMKPWRKTKVTSDGYTYSTSELRSKINEIMARGVFRFSNGKFANANDLAHFLFKINFLTARKVLEGGVIQRKYFEENNYLISNFVDFGYDWEVHMAYRWALKPDTLEDILSQTRP